MPSNAPSPSTTAIFREASQEARNLVNQLVAQCGESLDWVDDLRQLQLGYLDKSSQKGERECQAGCSGCCLSAQVDVTGIEAIAVSDYLRTCVDRPTLSQIQSRLERSTQRRIDQMRGTARQLPLACSMLGNDGRCTVYPVRPIICSGVFSTDRDACLDAEQTAKVGDFSSTIPLDNDAIQATGGISGTLQRILVEHGLDGNLYEFNSAVLAAITEKNSLNRFLAGEDLFRDAICTDPHSPPRKQAVGRPHFLKSRAAKRA
ncbi:YkgJ family cysteine cluster protein [Bremerella sp. P1]|uniref:YkgJ family cysteine cluster protein n=1 Tax=Bremerella sp. P1 TaxID=3026424 RepID=UPI002368C41E|nr:YkgJ family cysteine cluster protein [Bremerella sp. P1]WDI41172.1 YkgJ family cysteine cluster protein [Bremerella sp. P1]